MDCSILSVANPDTSDVLISLRRKTSEIIESRNERITVEGTQVVKMIASAIGRRASRLAGLATGWVILQIQLLGAEAAAMQHCKKADVAVDISVVEHYAGFEAHMREASRAMSGICMEGEARIITVHTKTGASDGAAITSLLAAQQIATDTHAAYLSYKKRAPLRDLMAMAFWAYGPSSFSPLEQSVSEVWFTGIQLRL